MDTRILVAQANIGGKIEGEGLGKFLPNGSNGLSQMEALMTMVVGFLTVVAGLSFLIYFMIGALNWVTAGGDQKKVDTAKSYMTNGAIGMIAVVASYAVVAIVGTVLGVNFLNLSGMAVFR